MNQFLIKKFRHYSVNAAKKSIVQKNRNRKDIQQSNHIAIIFDSTKNDAENIVMNYCEKLRQMGKKVTLLGYLPRLRKSDKVPSFNYCTNTDLKKLLDPQSESLKHFLKQEFDMLIGFFETPNIKLERLAYATNAGFKVGHYCQQHFCFDFMVESSGAFNFKDFALDVNKFLNKIIISTKQLELV